MLASSGHFANRGLRLLKIAFVLLALAALMGFAARLHWICEMACHFRFQYAILSLGTFAIFVVGRRRRWAVAAAALAALNAAAFVPLYVASSSTDTPRALRLMSFNANRGNHDFDAICQAIRDEKPDVLILVEYTPELADALTSLATEFPYRLESPRNDAFGIAIHSRLPLDDAQVNELRPGALPAITAKVATFAGRVTIIGAHVVPPVGRDRAATRNAQLRSLASLIRQQTFPVAVAGDLNITSYSPYFHDLLRESNLKDSRGGFGVQPTWPRQLPPLRIPIDHCLVSPAVNVLDRRVAGFAGSDHAAIVLDLAIP